MDKKHITKKKWNQEKVDGFLSFINNKLSNSENHSKKKQYLGLFIRFLKNENFKQNLAKCSSHSKVSLALESLLGSDQVTLEDLILLGSSLCKQRFYSDLLEKLILLLFQKHLSDKKTVEFLKMVWFDKEIICELPDTWTMYLNKWPTYLESLIFNILKSIKPTSVTEVDNIWNQCDSHFLIKMCCRQDKMFQCVCEVLNSMLTCSDCNKALLYVIRQFIASVTDYCIRSNKDIVDLYPRCVQSTVMCCRLGMFSNVATFAQNLPSNWKFILSTHHPKLTDLLLQKKTLL